MFFPDIASCFACLLEQCLPQTQAQPSGHLSDSDVYAITHAESAAASATPAKPLSSAQSATHEDKSQVPALMQLQALADADAITPQSKQSQNFADRLRRSPHGLQSPKAAASSPRAQRLPGLSQLRALAGVADSPQPPSQLKKTAGNLTDLASVPLSQWQFGNNGTSHAVWQADTPPLKQAGTSSPAGGPKSWTPARSASASAQPESSLFRAGSPAASPTAWGPSEPPKPVSLQIQVHGDAHRAETGLASCQDGSLHSSAGEKGNTMAADRGSDAGGFGFEAGYGSQRLGTADVHQPTSAVAAASASASARVPAGIFADGSRTMQAVDTSMSFRQPSGSAYPTHHSKAGAVAEQGPAAVLSNTPSQQNQSLDADRPYARADLGSAGADKLVEAASGMSGSPWDPKHGPKLLESLSDFSSFNSSLSLLQQLAGKSAAGLANLGIGKPAASSSPKSVEKKKSDKGHLISSAPMNWWQRHRPGSAKKKGPGPQGSGRRNSALAEGAGNGPDTPSGPAGVSRVRVPAESVAQQPDPLAINMPPVGLTVPGYAASRAVNSTQATAAVGSLSPQRAAKLQGGSAKGSMLATHPPGVPQAGQGSLAAAGDASSNIVYNLSTADRPLSSFKQDQVQSIPDQHSRAQAGQTPPKTAGGMRWLDQGSYAAGMAYSDRPVLAAGPVAGQALPGAEPAKVHEVDAVLASAAALSEFQYPEGVLAGPHQQGGLTLPSHEGSLANTYHEGRLPVPLHEGQSAEPSPESSPLPSPGSKANLGFAGFHNGASAIGSPGAGHLLAMSQTPNQHQGQQQQPKRVPMFGYTVQQESDAPASIADYRQPGSASGGGHVPTGPVASNKGGSALDQLYSLAQGSGMGAATPSTFGFVGQSLDLSKVRLLTYAQLCMECIAGLSLRLHAEWCVYAAGENSINKHAYVQQAVDGTSLHLHDT